jgi:hypothetical protein
VAIHLYWIFFFMIGKLSAGITANKFAVFASQAQYDNEGLRRLSDTIVDCHA